MPPAGTLFSSHLEIWPSSIVNGHFTRIAALVDNLHGMELTLSRRISGQRVQCCHKQPPRSDGKQWLKCDGRIFFMETPSEPWLIYLNPDAIHLLLTGAHEFGHLVEYAVKQAVLLRGSEVEAKFSTLTKWLENSTTTLRLASLSEQADQIELELLLRNLITQEPTMRTGTPLRDYIEYLVSTSELFARGYAQWVETRSVDKLLTYQIDYWLDTNRQKRVPEQWPRNEFIEGADAFDALFLELGWMK